MIRLARREFHRAIIGGANLSAMVAFANACAPIPCSETLTCLDSSGQMVGRIPGVDGDIETGATPGIDVDIPDAIAADELAPDSAIRDASVIDSTDAPLGDGPSGDGPTGDGPQPPVPTDASDSAPAACSGANLLSDPANCGRCGHACGSNSLCSSGRCTGYTVGPSSQAFVDACSLPGAVHVLPNVDDGNTPLTVLPFGLSFYGVAETQYWVNSNGVMGLGGIPSSAPLTSCPLPSAGNPHAAIYAFSDDLVTRSGGVCIATSGASPNRQMVVTWEDAAFASNDLGHLTFSIILSETTNTIDLVFQTMTGKADAQGSQATIGIEDSTARLGAQFSCKKPSILSTPMGVNFKPAP